MRRPPEIEDDDRIEAMARHVFDRLPEEGTENFDLLYDLSEGKSFDELARENRINATALPQRLAFLFGERQLNIPFPPRSAEAREILKRAFELLEDPG